MKTIHALSVLFLFLLTDCKSEVNESAPGEEEVASAPVPAQVTLIFDKNPGNSRYDWPNGSYSVLAPKFEVRYVDEHAVLRYFTPKLAPARDTLILPTERAVIEVQHVYKGLDVLSFLFQKGDTVLFTYDDKKPYASVLNRAVQPEELNYDLLKREQIMAGNFPGQVRMSPIFGLRDSLFMDLGSMEQKTNAAYRLGKAAAISEHRREQLWLDSLKEEGVLSPAAYAFYKGKSAFEMAKLPLKRRRKEQEPLSLNTPLQLEGLDVPALTFGELLQPRYDSLSYSIHYQELLRYVFNGYFSAGVDMIRTSNSNLPDYRQVYDSIRQNQDIGKQAKKLLLFRGIDEVIAQASVDDIETYWQKFKQDVPDTSFHNFISKKYGLGEEASNELQLENLAGERLTFSSVLAQHKGKVIYVDFWASWCTPCIRALPASAELHEAYKNEKVTFIYLSIDEDAGQWKKGAEKHRLQQYSYRVDNRFRSRMLDALALQSIPRYLVYNKAGNLVNENAPGPGSSETITLLNRYLAKITP